MLDLIRAREEKGEVIMSKEDFEKIMAEVDSLIETLEIMSDRDLMKQIEEGEKDIREGRVKEIKSRKDLERLLGA
jgi:PHD/YefM family antitoxin component YafN of YafNO toxin-antitoxin module